MVILTALFFGLILGSFFNVLIWRLPREESILWPPSHCIQCKRTIRPWENIPVISFLFLKCKCPGCGQKISWIYPLIELTTAFLSVLLSIIFLKSFALQISLADIPYLVLQYLFLLLMVPVAIIDIRHYIIPDLISLPLIVLGLAVSFFPENVTPIESLLGIILGGGSLYAIGWLGTAILKKGDAMGGGDIKLMAAAGALWGAKIALMGIVFGALLGSIAGIGIIFNKEKSLDHKIPFGPFLGAGLWIAVIMGERLVNLYIAFVESGIK
jgi:leader peptidase (prepilin peptidase)/N-methyltransferase